MWRIKYGCLAGHTASFERGQDTFSCVRVGGSFGGARSRRFPDSWPEPATQRRKEAVTAKYTKWSSKLKDASGNGQQLIPVENSMILGPS